jgi:hypothetical protein
LAKSVDCAAALLPQLEVENRSQAMSGAWLKLISEQTFDSFKQRAGLQSGASAGLPIEGVPVEFSGFLNGSWEDFQEKRRDYFSIETNAITEASALAVFRQSLTDKQLDAWLACVTSDQAGAFLVLSDDSAASVVATLRYRGIAGSKVKFDISLTNGLCEGKSKFTRELLHDTSSIFVVNRTSPPSSVIVVINSIPFSESAISIWPPPVIEKKLVFGAINANQFSVGLNVTDDRDVNPARLFVRAVDPKAPARLYIPVVGVPGGLSESSRLFAMYSSADNTEVRVALVGDEETAKAINPSTRVRLRRTGEQAGWATRKVGDLGEFPVKEGTNYIVIASDSGAQLPLLNAFWLEGRPGVESQ